VRVSLALTVVAALLLPSEAGAKEFRHYFGMQWVITPAPLPSGTLELVEGDTVTKARMLTEDLFEAQANGAANGKLIFAKGTQFATAVSSQAIRCTVARGEKGTLSFTRRICLTDANRDGVFDHYFDVGLGQGGFDVQFTGCIPNDAAVIEPVAMNAVAPDTLRDPMEFRVKLSKIYGKKVKSKSGAVSAIDNPSYEFGGSIGRNDRIWNYYSFCTQQSCRVWPGQSMDVAKEGIALRVVRQDGAKAVVEVLSNLRKHNYWDMSRGNRPDAMYCPGTLFVKTDAETF
jgi:hypothetical protein